MRCIYSISDYGVWYHTSLYSMYILDWLEFGTLFWLYGEEHSMFLIMMECLRSLFWALFMFHLCQDLQICCVCFSSFLSCVCLPLSVSVVSGWAWLTYIQLTCCSTHLRSIYTDHQLPVVSRSLPSSLLGYLLLLHFELVDFFACLGFLHSGSSFQYSKQFNTGWCNQLYESCFIQNWLLMHFVVRPQASPESLQTVQIATVRT